MNQSLLILPVSYLLGSFPTGYLAGRLKGIDVRQHGSGNIGATNVLRVLGKPWGIAVFLVDALKGYAAVAFARGIAGLDVGSAGYIDLFAIVAAATCVVGHSFPVWLRFRGGKGVATSVGALLGVVPIAAMVISLVWLTVFLTTRLVSLASIIAALALPAAVAILLGAGISHSSVLLYFSAGMAALVVWRHRSNITRLLNGTEPRFRRD